MKLYRRGKKGLFTVELWHRGKRIVQATGTTNKSKAEAFVRHLIATLEAGRYLPRQERVTWDELAVDLETYYQLQGLRSGSRLRCALTHLAGVFGGRRALDITPARIAAYTAFRLDAGAAKATVNWELAAISRAFNLAVHQHQKLSTAPRIQRLDASDNVRTGFVSIPDYAAIRAEMAEWLGLLTDFLYSTGVRLGEGRTLEWRDVDWRARVIRIRAERVKTKEPHEIPLAGRVVEIIDRAVKARRLDCAFVFHRAGREILKNTAAIHWRRATQRAGFAGVRIHDLRRSFVRNMRQFGVPEIAIMKFTGHRTRQIFDRYSIVDNEEKRSILDAFERWASEQPTRGGIVAGHFAKQSQSAESKTGKNNVELGKRGTERNKLPNAVFGGRKP